MTEFGKKSIKGFLKEYENLTNKVMQRELNLINAAAELMGLCWRLVWDLVNEWQIEINEAQHEVKKCPQCGKKMYTHKVTHPKLIFPFGCIEWYHRKVRCPACGYKESLLKRWIPEGLERRITPLVGKKLIWLSAMMPYREALSYVKEYWGLELSLKSFQNYVQKVGKELLKLTDLVSGSMDVIEDKLDKVYIYTDGVMVYINKRWQEVKVGIIECHKKGKVYYKYYAEKTNWKSFLKHMEEIGNRLNVHSAGVKIFLSDAGKGITSYVRTYFFDYNFLIDYYHATKHITEWLNQLKERNKQVLAKRRKELTTLLYKGKIKELVTAMQSIRGKKENKVLLREEKFFLNHESSFDYARFRQHRWYIGSGKIESACRWLIQQRFKLSGMRWKEGGFRLILGLRVAFYNKTLFPAFTSMMTQGKG